MRYGFDASALTTDGFTFTWYDGRGAPRGTEPDLKPVNHYHQFVDAILGTTRTAADFDYAAPLAESLLLGTVAARFPERKLTWDAKAMKLTNLPEANAFL